MAIAIPIPEKLLSFLSEKVAPIIRLETRKILNIPELVEDIENEVDMANVFLRKIEEKEERENERIKNKIRVLRELVFKIEDILDEYKVVGKQLFYHPFGGNEYSGCLIGIHEFLQEQSAKVSEFRDKHRIACRIVKIKKAMENLKGKENNYEKSIFAHTQDSEDSDIDDFEEQKRRVKKKINDPSYCPLYKDEEELVGFIEYKQQLLSKLDLEKKIYSQQFVLAVWGQAGVGKTTLVRKMYEDEDVKKNFCCTAWITATKPHKKVHLLKCLFRQFICTSLETCQIAKFSEEKVQKLEDDEVIITNKLREFLTSHNPKCNKNRYFVVLDDVSENEELSRIIKAALVPKQKQGGRLILTTKSESIAKYWKTSSPNGETHNLSVLCVKDSKDLFDKIAFGNNGKCPLKLEGLRNKIVEECDGFPFLIEKVASYFSTSDKWIELYQNFQINPLRARNKRVLLSNYHDMPYHLKPCFLYLCVFPKGQVLDRMRIVRLWIAEGFVQPKDITYEEAAEEYLNELVQRGMVHVVRRDDTGRFREYQLPRMWHQIMLPKLADLSFCKVLSRNNCFNTNNQCRRWSIHTDIDDTSIPTSVRSVLSFAQPERFPISWSSPFHETSFRLKVLDLQNANFEDIPRVLGKLWNLRYLSLRNTKVKTIPKTIGGLFNLQTLDLKQTYVKNLPIEVNMLHKLRHLLVGRCTSKRIYPVKIDPMVLESLTDLQKLVYLNASFKKVVSELGKLSNLRRLGIERLSCEDSQNLCICLKNMQFLRSLSITMLPNENIDLRIMNDDQALPFLERLYLVGKLEGNELPKWIVQLKHLVKIMLKNSRFNKNPLAQLRFMKELLVLELDNPFMLQDDNSSKKSANGGNSVLDYCRLESPLIQKYRYGQVKQNKCSVNNSYGGRSIEFGKVLDFGQTTGFPKLQELRIKNMSKLESMIAKSSKVLPQLQKVSYENCPKLITQDENLPKQMKGIVCEMSKY